jgi:uncharacterized repeat protein (TIGR03837 family)
MRIDIFCKVVDNYGDAGFSWRLTRRLTELLNNGYFTASQNDAPNKIRLFCDNLNLILELAGTETISKLAAKGLELKDWYDAEIINLSNQPPQVVIETFSCELPINYATQIAKSLLINIEYLTAESWIEEIHCLATLPSISGQNKRYFFCPGFNEKTGGLLGKSKNPDQKLISDVIDRLFLSVREDSIQISTFNYGQPTFIRFLEQLLSENRKIDIFVCYGKPQLAIANWLGKSFNKIIDKGNLRLIPIPFLTQDEYDELLQRCDLNWVRGEDSFVRAQWAGKPFIWDIYPQTEEFHLKKLDAFLEIYLPHEDSLLSKNFAKMMINQDVDVTWEQLQAMQKHSLHWKKYLQSQEQFGDLGQRLLGFIKELIKTG